MIFLATIRRITASAVMACCASPAISLDSRLSIDDPALIEILDRDFGVAQILARKPAGEKLNNAQLFTQSGMKVIRTYLLAKIAAYENNEAGEQVLDARFVKGEIARFQLSGIVNRMDRGFIPELRSACGEVRLIYRLYYAGRTKMGGEEEPVASRLPMTMNVVLKANSGDGCAAVAKRWLTAIPTRGSATDKAAFLRDTGALKNVSAQQIDRIEFNYQILRRKANDGKATVSSFGGRAEYLLSVFRWDAGKTAFMQDKMENQIDPARFKTNAADRKTLQDAVLNERFLRDLDNGRAIIPHVLTAKDAISISPGGQTRTRNRPFDGLFDPVAFKKVLDQFASRGERLNTVQSFEGFVARLNDLTCAGCHQTRAIAGFHFPGADWPGGDVINKVFVPASPHFYGDLPRRLEVVKAYAAGTTPNFRRSFAARAEPRTAEALAGTQIADGWGATCYKPPSPETSDKSFSRMEKCQDGLTCVVLSKSSLHPHMGMCVPAATAIQVGDPLEITEVKYDTSSTGFDKERLSNPEIPERAASVGLSPYRAPPPSTKYLRAHQRGMNGFGGFPAGMLRLNDCAPGTAYGAPASPDHPESVCVDIADDGFNDCIKKYPFTLCFNKKKLNSADKPVVQPGGVRACDISRPCREDYICTTTAKSGIGACIPPYFVFQFRVDQHPRDIR